MASATGLGAAVGALVTAGRGRTRLRALTIGPQRSSCSSWPPRQRRVCRSNCWCSPWSGPASVSFLAVGNTTVQLTTLPTMRGRVMALQAVAFLGSTPVGGPIAGWVSRYGGGRAGLVLGHSACLLAARLGLAARLMVCLRIG